MTRTCGRCGLSKPIVAKGLCSQCYEQTKPRVVCADCGNQRRAAKRIGEHALCQRCWDLRNAVACSRCALVKPRVNRASQPPLCGGCWTAARPAIFCASCGATRQPGGVDDQGRHICPRCANDRRARVVCVSCGRSRQPHSRAQGGGHLCSNCASRTRPHELCGNCGRHREVTSRAEDGSARCNRCWQANHHAVCAGCGRDRKIVFRTRSGEPLCRACNPSTESAACAGCGRVGVHPTRDAHGQPQCSSCWRAQRLPCSRCREVTLVALRWPDGPVCAGCVDEALADPQPCTGCGMSRPNVAAGGAPPRCPSCTNLRFDYQCTGCGTFVRPLLRGRCVPCRLAHAIRAVAPDGIPAELTEFVEEALLAIPARGLRILNNPKAAALLRRVITEYAKRRDGAVGQSGGAVLLRHLPPQRLATDDQEPDASTELLGELRTALAAGGVLPHEPSLERYHQRVQELIASVSGPARIILRRYTRWSLTRPLQLDVDDGATVTEGLVRWPLTRARVAAQFLTAIGAQGIATDTVSQSHLDTWVQELPGHQAPLRAFVIWAVAHRYLPAGLEVPAARSREVRTAMGDAERLALVRHLLRERDDDPPARLAAVLVLLFGQQVTRLAVLRLSALVVDDDGRVTLALSSTPLRLREPLAGLALRVADGARAHASAWLFPSSQGNRPLSADRLRERLAALGVDRALHARNGALSALAAQLPPALLADQLGLSLSTAALWSKATGAARSDYTALRGGSYGVARPTRGISTTPGRPPPPTSQPTYKPSPPPSPPSPANRIFLRRASKSSESAADTTSIQCSSRRNTAASANVAISPPVRQRRPCCRATLSATLRWMPARQRMSSTPAYGLLLSGLTSTPRRTQTSAGRIR
jgi:hypothetical protein